MTLKTVCVGAWMGDMSPAVKPRKFWWVAGAAVMLTAIVGGCQAGGGSEPPKRTACDLLSTETINQATGGVKSSPPGGVLEPSGDDRWVGRCDLWAADKSGLQLRLKSAYPTKGAASGNIQYKLNDPDYNDGIWSKCERYKDTFKDGMKCEHKAERNQRKQWSIYAVYKDASISVVVEPAPGKTVSAERLATAEKVAKEFVDNFVPYADKRLDVTDPSR